MIADLTLQLAASPGFHLPVLGDEGPRPGRAHPDGPENGEPEGGEEPALVAAPPRERRVESVYYDTDDLRLVRSGCSLEHRVGGGWILTLAAAGAPRALTFDGRAASVPATALRLVAAFQLGRELHPVARLSTWEHVVTLSDESGRELLAVVDEEVSVLEGRRVAARFRDIGIKLVDEAGREHLDEIRRRLEAAGAGTQQPLPKVVRALGPPAQRPPDLVAARAGADATVAEAVRAGLSGPAASLLSNDALLRLGDVPDAVRKVRVAARRLRSLLRTFEPLLDADLVAETSAELAWAADEVGRVRDLDVRAARLTRLSERLEPEARRGALAFADLAAAKAAEARSGLPAVLDSDRYLSLLERVAATATNPPLVVDAGRPAAGVLVPLARRSWRRLRRAVRALGSEPSEAELHGIRIRGKRARYAAEAVALVVPEAGALVTAMEAVQDALGEHHDSAVTRAWLRDVAGGGRRAFVAGRLYELERQVEVAAVADFETAWRAARRPRLRKWMQ